MNCCLSQVSKRRLRESGTSKIQWAVLNIEFKWRYACSQKSVSLLMSLHDQLQRQCYYKHCSGGRKEQAPTRLGSLTNLTLFSGVALLVFPVIVNYLKENMGMKRQGRQYFSKGKAQRLVCPWVTFVPLSVISETGEGIDRNGQGAKLCVCALWVSSLICSW